MDAAKKKLVRDRAGDRCEYCHLPQAATPAFTFHVEHVRARQHGGKSEPGNLALACHRCNAYKGPNLVAIDPETDRVTPLFHPREHLWSDHFRLVGLEIIGVTAVGRAAVKLLHMNAEDRMQLRESIMAEDRLDLG